jgi:proteasome alpha subunit
MIEEPYRWVEAVVNRREYVETQLAGGSPIAAVSCREGIVLVTVGRSRQKLFEIYDRIGMGAIGHPGDIERLRLAAIELASTEGFTRSAADVSLRRLAYYSLSPVLKGAFEQIYGAPYLVRMLFAEIGATAEEDLFLRIEYDGAIATSGHAPAESHHGFGVLSGTQTSAELMEAFLREQHDPATKLARAFATALDAWSIGNMALGEAGVRERPAREALAAEREKHVASGAIEAAVLEREAKSAIRYRPLGRAEIAALVAP